MQYIFLLIVIIVFTTDLDDIKMQFKSIMKDFTANTSRATENLSTTFFTQEEEETYIGIHPFLCENDFDAATPKSRIMIFAEIKDNSKRNIILDFQPLPNGMAIPSEAIKPRLWRTWNSKS